MSRFTRNNPEARRKRKRKPADEPRNTVGSVANVLPVNLARQPTSPAVRGAIFERAREAGNNEAMVACYYDEIEEHRLNRFHHAHDAAVEKVLARPKNSKLAPRTVNMAQALRRTGWD